MEKKVYTNTTGLSIPIDMGENITGATNIVLNVTKPDGTTTTWDGATVYNENYIKYTTTSGDLNIAGLYKIQPTFTLSGWSGPAKTVSFRVYSRYE